DTDIIQGIEMKWKRKDGSVLDVRYNGRKVRDESGAFVYYEGFVEDMTERNRLQKQLLQSQKMETIGTMAGGIAHDFNNQLTVILGNLDLALMEAPEGAGLFENLQNAMKAAKRCAELTRSILAFGRQISTEPRPMNLNAAVDEATRLLERSFPASVRLNVQKLGHLWTINADNTQMQQVLMNLCVNARDAMPGGGMLTVRTSNKTLTDADCTQNVEARPGRYICLIVQDTGTGIPAEILPRIFEPFFTTKEVGKGTGLGLAMVYGIVKAHDGWIQVSSQVGTGTTFTVFLPAVVAVIIEEKPQVVSAPGGSETILVVDDEDLVLGLARSILERHGYKVVTACDGVDALELFRKMHSRIDAIVLDLNMPRMTGLEALGPLRQIRSDIPIIISSGYRADLEAREALENGAAGFVQKPYTPAVMAQALRRILDDWKKGARAYRKAPEPAS
ncbi:MAG: response regulator, partial [bacterium]